MDAYPVYVVKGEVTLPDAWGEEQVGQVEWQFSDGPPGERGSSADFLDLQEGFDYMGAQQYIMVDSGEVQ